MAFVMLPLPWQVYYNGLTVGGNVNGPVQYRTITGLEDLPDLTTGDNPRPRDVGMVRGLDFPAGRTITIDLDITAAPGLTLSQTVDQVKAAFVPSPDTDPTAELPLYVTLPGENQRQVNCRVRQRSGFDINPAYTAGYVTGSVQLYASDPRVYTAQVQSVTIGLPDPPAGLTFPVRFPFGFGGTPAGVGVYVNNLGTWPTRAVATLTGPCTDPYIENLTTGDSFSTSIVLAATDLLVVDFDARTVLRNGGDVWAYVQPGSSWYAGELPPGLSQLAFHSLDGGDTGATMTVNYQSAWL